MNTVSVMLRYRPGPDVLVGEVDLPDVQLFTEVVHPDIVIRWQATLVGEVLHSFQLVDAARHLAEGDVPLPKVLLHELQRVVARPAVEERVECELVVSSNLLRRRARVGAHASVQ